MVVHTPGTSYHESFANMHAGEAYVLLELNDLVVSYSNRHCELPHFMERLGISCLEVVQ
jgi:hypothetical protein